MNDFITNILNILKNNGYPQKRVTLPTERMYEVADSKGLSFNKVLEVLRDEHQVDSEVGSEKIVFSTMVKQQQASSPEEMMKQAQEMMSKMSPEELQRIQDMFMNMSPEEKEEIMKKGKELGLL